ncbi:MAG: ROK family protein [Sulfurimonas sp.]|uniref:ROK family protein n=1 Tax=Sulfurimonas sp. TaxID=2022749 RepID=UPI00262E2003|nr:ROK family protein [Sulfurimonas sp.]MDD2652251.1 ROK family protein [Sulfurimonas sp.]MDD3451580.1 ROK family protein [Sulfurimonas sp.]
MNLAIDAGGTHLRAEIWHKGLLAASKEAKSTEIGLCAWIEELLLEFCEVQTVGISYAGQVEDGIIHSSPNIRVDCHNIKEVVEQKFGVKLYIQNDLNCAVLAEAKEFGVQNICALYVGTGLGLGVVEDGRVVRGAHNVATELGHIPYKKTVLTCGCGRNNCLELFASGSGIAKQIASKNLICAPTLEALKAIGEDAIATSFEEALLVAAGTTLTLFNPQVLVLGGGVIEANPYLEELILKNINLYTLSNSLQNLKICKSKLKNAPLTGALLLKDLT